MNKLNIIKNISLAILSVSTVVSAIASYNYFSFKNSKKEDDYETGDFYEWEHGSVHYIKKGTGKPLLLIHGIIPGSNHREFEKNIDFLSENFTVYAVDLPGYGYSCTPKITYTAFTYSLFIKSFIENVIGNDKQTTIIASNGGSIFSTITAKLFPNLIDKLVLISPQGIKDVESSDKKLKRFILELPLIGTLLYNLKTSKGKIKNFLLEYGFFSPDFVLETSELFYYGAHGTNKNAKFAYASYATNYMNFNIENYINILDKKIYILWGEKNNFNSIDNMYFINNIHNKSNFFIFEDTKMFPHIENYLEFNNTINDINKKG